MAPSVALLFHLLAVLATTAAASATTQPGEVGESNEDAEAAASSRLGAAGGRLKGNHERWNIPASIGHGGSDVRVLNRNSGPCTISCRLPPQHQNPQIQQQSQSAASSQVQSVRWLHDGQPLHQDSRRRINSTSLTFKKVVHKKKWSLDVGLTNANGLSDAGEYRCLATNSNGAFLSPPVHVVIAGIAHDYLTWPENVTAAAGTVVRLTCSIDSVPPANIQWEKDSFHLPHNQRYFATDSGSLYISNLKREDAGKYRCVAANPMVGKPRYSKEGTLSVAPYLDVVAKQMGATPYFLDGAPPSTLLLPPSSLLPSTSIGSVVCASPIPHSSLTWIHTKPDGTNTTISTNKGLNILKVGINSVYKNGTFFCILSLANKVTAVKGVNVSRYSSGLIAGSEQMPATLRWPTGKTLQLPCNLIGANPSPSVIWYKDADRLVIDGKLKLRSNNLTVSTVEATDSGYYQCELWQDSSLGLALIGPQETYWWASGDRRIPFVFSNLVTTRLAVVPLGDQPPRPVNVTCHAVSSTAIATSWDVPKFKHDIPGFTLHVTPSDGGEEDRDLVLNTTKFIKERLFPYTNYTFYVRSFAGRSLSESSKKVTCSTAEAVPTGWPDVTLKALSNCCLMISWSPPPTSQARGAITHYRVQWKLNNQTFINFQLLPGYIRQFSVRDVQVGGEYLVRVLAATSLGWPENKDQVPWKNITLPKLFYNRLPPPYVNAYILDPTAISVEWYPSDEGYIKGYNLYFKKLPEEIVGAVILGSNVTQYTISALKSDRWYEIGVSSYDEDSGGEPCPVTLRLSSTLVVGAGGQAEAVVASLEPPRRLSAVSHSALSLTVSWTSVQDAASYTVHFAESYPVNATSTVVAINDTSLVLSGLKSGVYYDLEVIAWGNSKTVFSSPGGPLQAQTLPQGNYHLSWKSIGNGTAEVSWSKASTGDGNRLSGQFQTDDAIVSYTLYYSPDLSAPLHHWQQMELPASATSALLVDLKCNIKYNIKLKGSAGSGEVTFLAGETSFTLADESVMAGDPSHSLYKSDQILGILVGCAISACFMAICSMSVIYRRRCFKDHRHRGSSASAPGSGRQHSATNIEMLALTHQTSNTPARLTTMGDLSNGPLNGVRLPLILNGKIPNGHLNEKNLRITENPQYEGVSRSGVARSDGDEGSNRTTDEGDSLLSGGDAVGGMINCRDDDDEECDAVHCCRQQPFDSDSSNGNDHRHHHHHHAWSPDENVPAAIIPIIAGSVKPVYSDPDDGFVDSNHMLA